MHPLRMPPTRALLLLLLPLAGWASTGHARSDFQGVNLNPAQHANGPMPKEADLEGKAILFYAYTHTKDRAGAAKDLTALAEVAKGYGTDRLWIIASDRFKGHLNEVWTFAAKQANSKGIALFQGIALQGRNPADGEAFLFDAEGKKVYSGDVDGVAAAVAKLLGAPTAPGAAKKRKAARITDVALPTPLSGPAVADGALTGRTVIVYSFAAKGSARKDLATLNELAASYGPEKLVVIANAIDPKKSDKSITAYVERATKRKTALTAVRDAEIPGVGEDAMDQIVVFDAKGKRRNQGKVETILEVLRIQLGPPSK